MIKIDKVYTSKDLKELNRIMFDEVERYLKNLNDLKEWLEKFNYETEITEFVFSENINIADLTEEFCMNILDMDELTAKLLARHPYPGHRSCITWNCIKEQLLRCEDEDIKENGHIIWDGLNHLVYPHGLNNYRMCNFRNSMQTHEVPRYMLKVKYGTWKVFKTKDIFKKMKDLGYDGCTSNYTNEVYMFNVNKNTFIDSRVIK